MIARKLTKSFFEQPTLKVAENLLGKFLIVQRDGKRVAGKIVETEAYIGEDDLACHASKGRTNRSEILYRKAGTVYVYLVYGMYYCLNIVTERENFPSAVLIRAIEPIEGIDLMKKIFFIAIILIIVVGALFAGVFYWRYLRGIGPTIKQPPQDITKTIERK